MSEKQRAERAEKLLRELAARLQRLEESEVRKETVRERLLALRGTLEKEAAAQNALKAENDRLRAELAALKKGGAAAAAGAGAGAAAAAAESTKPMTEEEKAKAAKKAAKAAKKEEARRAKAERAAKKAREQERKVVLVAEPEGEAKFGDYELVQSRYKTDREFANLAELDASKNGQSVWIRGRLHRMRLTGKRFFSVVRRGVRSVQCIGAVSDEVPQAFVKYASKTPPESVVEILGKVVKPEKPIEACSQTEVEIVVERWYVVSASAPRLPFQLDDAAARVEAGDAAAAAAAAAEEEEKKKKSKKSKKGKKGDEEKEEVKEAGDDEWARVSQSQRLNTRWLDIRTPASNGIFRIQSGVCQFYREYFLGRGFVEIHTPKITPGVSEGGADVFRLKYFGRDACLAQSPQLFKQMAINSDLGRVFEIGPVFRAENSNTHRHMCEFVGMDFEMEIREHYHEVLHELGSCFVHIFDRLNEVFKAEIEAVRAQYPFEDLKYHRKTTIIHFPEAVQMLRGAGVEMGDFDDFSTAQEKLLGQLVREKYETDFYIVDQYPMAARPFYTMPDPNNPKYTNSYDVFLRGEEITSGAQRVHDVKKLEAQALMKEIPLDNITDYLNSFRLGAYPHGGAGIGLERVVMLFLSLNNIRKSSFFPRTPNRLCP